MVDAETRKKNRDPRRNVQRAWKVVVAPRQYSLRAKKQLLARGLEPYVGVDSGELDERQLLIDTSDFILDALDIRGLEESVLSDPPSIIESPGRLTVYTSLGVSLVNRHPVVREESYRKSILPRHIRDYHLAITKAAAMTGEHRDYILEAMGEIAYSRDQTDKYGPPVGSPVEGIEYLEHTDQWYFKVPLVHANRQCEARSERGEMLNIIDEEYVYVPIEDVLEKYDDYFSRNRLAEPFNSIVENDFFSDSQLDVYQSNITSVNDRISYWANNGHETRIFEERRYPRTLKAILTAIEGVESDIATLGEPLTIEDVHNATQRFANDTDKDWIRSVLTDIESVSSLSNQLRSYAADEDINDVIVTEDESGKDQYVFQYQVGNVKRIEPKNIADLLELPCMQNLHESLQHGKQTRWELFSFVRYLFEVKDLDADVEDIKNWFEQHYPWYHEPTSEYQIRYEKRQSERGDRPFPISCNCENQRWAEHCIGKENCEYSLYRSVQLKQRVYDSLDS